MASFTAGGGGEVPATTTTLSCKYCLCDISTASATDASTVPEDSLDGLFKLQCNCSFHYNCIVEYLRNCVNNKLSISRGGVECPNTNNKSEKKEDTCAFCVPSKYLTHIIDEEELQIIVKHGNSVVSCARQLNKSKIDVYAKNVGYPNPSPTKDEFVQFVKSSVFSTVDSKKIVEYVKEGLKTYKPAVWLDPYVEATSKGCPTCSYRSTHYQGHNCHRIYSCPGCKHYYCYRCGDTSHNCSSTCDLYCPAIRDINDVIKNVKFNSNIPYDSRCGCVFCSECKKDAPCQYCPGDCAVCRGLIIPGPSELLPVRASQMSIKSILVNSIDGPAESVKAVTIKKAYKLWDACKYGLFLGEDQSYFTSIVNQQDNYGRTGLIMACWANQLAIIPQVLAIPNIDVNIADKSGKSALHWAAICGHEGPVQMLIARPEINTNSYWMYGDSGTALCCAVKEKRHNIIRTLCAHVTTDVNVCNPLHIAVSTNDPETVAALLSCGRIEINSLNASRASSLHIACASRNPEIVKMIASVPGVNPYLIDSSDATPALVAMKSLKPANINELISAISDFDVNKDYGAERTLLHWAALHGFTATISILLKNPNIDVDKVDFEGRTALYHASENGHIDSVNLLTDYNGGNGSRASTDDSSIGAEVSRFALLLDGSGLDSASSSPRGAGGGGGVKLDHNL